ncbi:hypothetical protein Fcan01_05172 [Folsomia candida]|uniref:Uncharacterized protein n=1 Tax=Folsomia candida TaxID=158441 RepID=A0A226EQS8_FOLCA|nr:hypothetical protein Fcan01_05172 [Folsomia candida]
MRLFKTVSSVVMEQRSGKVHPKVVRSQRARNAHEDENSNIWTRQSPPNSTPISQNISIIAAPSYSEVVDNSHDFPSVLYINECTKNIDTDDPPPTYQEFLTMNNTRKQENNL